MTLPDLALYALILAPLLGGWGLVLADIVRRDDASRVWKAGWALTTFALPFLGALIYLLFRPAGLTAEEREAEIAKRP